MGMRGSTHKIPDAFSRAPIEDQQAETAIEKHVNLIIHQQFAVKTMQTTTHPNDARLDELRKIARDDSEYNTLRTCVKEGFLKNLKDPHRQQNNSGICGMIYQLKIS